MKPYRVLIKAKQGWKIYAKCRTRAEADLILTNLNTKNLSKLYEQYSVQGSRQPSHELVASVYARTAIQY